MMGIEWHPNSLKMGIKCQVHTTTTLNICAILNHWANPVILHIWSPCIEVLLLDGPVSDAFDSETLNIQDGHKRGHDHIHIGP